MSPLYPVNGTHKKAKPDGFAFFYRLGSCFLERDIVIKAVEIRSRLRSGLLLRSRTRLLRCRRLLRTWSLLAWSRGRLLIVVAPALLVALLWTAAQQLHGALPVSYTHLTLPTTPYV